MKLLNKKFDAVIATYILMLIMVTAPQQVFAHSTVFDCHGNMIVQLRTNYTHAEFDYAVTRGRIVRNNEWFYNVYTLDGSESLDTGIRIYQKDGTHNQDVNSFSVELWKGTELIASRPVRVDMDGVGCGVNIVTVLIAKPESAAVKTWELVEDRDFNGVPSAGDILRFSVSLDVSGNCKGNGSYKDLLGENLRLIPGSVFTSHGEVFVGNEQDENENQVNITDIELQHNGVRSAEIVFDTEILPPVISSQGAFSYHLGKPGGSRMKTQTLLTDDPTTQEPADPTIIPLQDFKGGGDPNDPIPPPN